MCVVFGVFLCFFCRPAGRGVHGRGVRGEGKPSPLRGSKIRSTEGSTDFGSPLGVLLAPCWDQFSALESLWRSLGSIRDPFLLFLVACRFQPHF